MTKCTSLNHGLAVRKGIPSGLANFLLIELGRFTKERYARIITEEIAGPACTCLKSLNTLCQIY